MGLQLYGYQLSQPSRAVMSFCQIMDIPYNLNKVNIMKGEQRKPEFLKFNPTGKIPVLIDTTRKTVIFQSEAIVKYLALFYCNKSPDKLQKWYPMGAGSDTEKLRAVRMQMYLSWHHNNLRQSSMITIGTWAPIKDKANTIRRGERFLQRALQFMEKNYLAHSDYIVGDHPTFADLQAVHELFMFALLPEQKYWGWICDSTKNPKVVQWMNRMIRIDVVNSQFEKAAGRRLEPKL